jgi:hypothetical protein
VLCIDVIVVCSDETMWIVLVLCVCREHSVVCDKLWKHIDVGGRERQRKRSRQLVARERSHDSVSSSGAAGSGACGSRHDIGSCAVVRCVVCGQSDATTGEGEQCHGVGYTCVGDGVDVSAAM